jgi:hypothetical protein
MQFLTAPPDRDHKVRGFQQLEVFGHGLSGHVKVPAKLTERLPIVRMQSVEQLRRPASASALNTASIRSLCN